MTKIQSQALKCLMSKEDLLFNLKQGLEMEYKARDICRDLAKKLQKEDDKNKVLAIAKDEEKHIRVTKDLIKLARRGYI